jgi:DNA invertase Pin-like site-specific DNA recombinase
MATTLLVMAEFENNRRKERQKKGEYQWRKTVINKTLIQKVKHLKESKKLSVTDISKRTGVTCTTIYKVLKEHLSYVSNRLVKLEETNKPE